MVTNLVMFSCVGFDVLKYLSVLGSELESGC